MLNFFIGLVGALFVGAGIIFGIVKSLNKKKLSGAPKTLLLETILLER